MKNRVIYSSLGLIFLLVLIPSINAEILFSQPSSKYNFGDNFNINIQVKESIETNDFLKVNLVCDSDVVELYKSPLRIQSGNSENITIKAKLDRSLISDSNGDCAILASYGDETSSSSPFEISDNIELSITLSSNSFDPGQSVYIFGSAKKQNGDKINGFVQIYLSNTNVSFLANAESNNFNYSFLMPQDMPAGIYSLNVKIYERELSGEISNEGIYSSTIRVNQVIKSGDVSISSVSVYPQENISYSINLKDQSGKEVKTDVNSIIYTSAESNNLFLRKTSKSGDTIYIEIPKNALPGKWEIEGLYSSLPLNRSFTVLPLSKASFAIQGDEITITNQGNVEYNQSIVLFIGTHPEKPELSIPVGSFKTFRVDAPKGSYDINISDGNGNEFELGILTINQTSRSPSYGGWLTARAISLEDPNSSNSSYFRVLFWFVIIIILLFLVTYYYRRVRKYKFYAKKPQSLSRTSLALKTQRYSPVQAEESSPVQRRVMPNNNDEEKRIQTTPLFDTYDSATENKQVLGDYEAKKEEVIVLALKVKNGQKLRQSESQAFNAIRNALHKAKMAKAKVYDQGDINLVVFSKSLSDKADAVESVKVAYDLDLTLKEYNKKYAIKIDYGLGMHTGEMFFEIIDGKAKFTSIGNITILPKNLAARADYGLLVSQELYRKIYSSVKSEQDESGAYKILSLKGERGHSQFIERFMGKSPKEQVQTPHPHRSIHHKIEHKEHNPSTSHSMKARHSRFATEHNVHRDDSPHPPTKDSNPHPPKKTTFQRY